MPQGGTRRSTSTVEMVPWYRNRINSIRLFPQSIKQQNNRVPPAEAMIFFTRIASFAPPKPPCFLGMGAKALPDPTGQVSRPP